MCGTTGRVQDPPLHGFSVRSIIFIDFRKCNDANSPPSSSCNLRDRSFDRRDISAYPAVGAPACRFQPCRLALSTQPDHSPRPSAHLEQHFQQRRRALPEALPCLSRGHQSRDMQLHAGQSQDAINWQLAPERIVFVPDNPVAAEINAWGYGYHPCVTWLEDRYYVTWCNYHHRPTDRRGLYPRLRDVLSTRQRLSPVQSQRRAVSPANRWQSMPC